jgi:hypothetical protein
MTATVGSSKVMDHANFSVSGNDLFTSGEWPPKSKDYRPRRLT